MTTDELSAELLLPPKRLGTLLAEARLSHGYTLAEATEALGNDWDPIELLEVETGRKPLLDPDLAVLTQLYGITTSKLIPDRSRLVIDLDEGVLSVGAHQVALNADAHQRDVLARYLAMVYTMRELPPGREITLRNPDLDVLGAALRRPADEVEAQLRELMVDSSAIVAPRMRRLRGRLLVPAIGLVVAATTAGVLLLVKDSDASPGTDDGAASADGSSSTPTEIGDAVVQERLADGTPGEVQIRN